MTTSAVGVAVVEVGRRLPLLHLPSLPPPSSPPIPRSPLAGLFSFTPSRILAPLSLVAPHAADRRRRWAGAAAAAAAGRVWHAGIVSLRRLAVVAGHRRALPPGPWWLATPVADTHRRRPPGVCLGRAHFFGVSRPRRFPPLPLFPPSRPPFARQHHEAHPLYPQPLGHRGDPLVPAAAARARRGPPRRPVRRVVCCDRPRADAHCPVAALLGGGGPPDAAARAAQLRRHHVGGGRGRARLSCPRRVGRVVWDAPGGRPLRHAPGAPPPTPRWSSPPPRGRTYRSTRAAPAWSSFPSTCWCTRCRTGGTG